MYTPPGDRVGTGIHARSSSAQPQIGVIAAATSAQRGRDQWEPACCEWACCLNKVAKPRRPGSTCREKFGSSFYVSSERDFQWGRNGGARASYRSQENLWCSKSNEIFQNCGALTPKTPSKLSPSSFWSSTTKATCAPIGSIPRYASGIRTFMR